MLNLWGASPVDRDDGGHLYATQTVGRRRSRQATWWNDKVFGTVVMSTIRAGTWARSGMHSGRDRVDLMVVSEPHGTRSPKSPRPTSWLSRNGPREGPRRARADRVDQACEQQGQPRREARSTRGNTVGATKEVQGGASRTQACSKAGATWPRQFAILVKPCGKTPVGWAPRGRDKQWRGDSDWRWMLAQLQTVRTQLATRNRPTLRRSSAGRRGRGRLL